MPVEDFSDDLPSSAPPGLRAAVSADRARRRAGGGGRPIPSYANKYCVYWVDPTGAVYFSDRHRDAANVQYSRRTGESSMHPDLRAQGYMLIDEACADDDAELARIRKHIEDHERRIDRGRKDRLVFSPPIEDLPLLCVERMAEHAKGEAKERAVAELRRRKGRGGRSRKTDGGATS